MSDYFLRLPLVIQRTGLPRSTLYRLIGEGRFPKQVPLTQRTVGWKASSVQRWLDDPIGFREEQG
ncbi:helix-turn-helix transcriptional regulator [Sphingomonas sp. Leaf231]|uniref:helix-turn-helix transcriptional regulator n=1 Tax=Sphingomonas sp. Leaf231 TaxID=1736301 RepID=UPI0009EAD796|nr:AlpA family phage regulatory protein [Sphingomonas sp. Leaf231]